MIKEEQEEDSKQTVTIAGDNKCVVLPTEAASLQPHAAVSASLRSCESSFIEKAFSSLKYSYYQPFFSINGSTINRLRDNGAVLPLSSC